MHDALPSYRHGVPSLNREISSGSPTDFAYQACLHDVAALHELGDVVGRYIYIYTVQARVELPYLIIIVFSKNDIVTTIISAGHLK